jgi:hypothetical protein
MSSFLYRGSYNRKLFNHTPRKISNKVVKKEEDELVTLPVVGKVSHTKFVVIGIVILVVVTLLILLL